MNPDPKSNHLDVQKQRINRILDLQPNVEVQNVPSDSLLILNNYTDDYEMTNEDFHEMTNFDCRKRNLSSSSCDSTEINKLLYGNKEIIYYELKNEDTLAKLALEFACKVSIKL